MFTLDTFGPAVTVTIMSLDNPSLTKPDTGWVELPNEVCAIFDWWITKIEHENYTEFESNDGWGGPSGFSMIFVINNLSRFGWKIGDDLSVEIDGHNIAFKKV